MNDDKIQAPVARLFIKKGDRVEELGFAFPSVELAQKEADDMLGDSRYGVDAVPHHITLDGEIVHRFPAYDDSMPVTEYWDDAEDDE